MFLLIFHSLLLLTLFSFLSISCSSSFSTSSLFFHLFSPYHSSFDPLPPPSPPPPEHHKSFSLISFPPQVLFSPHLHPAIITSLCHSHPMILSPSLSPSRLSRTSLRLSIASIIDLSHFFAPCHPSSHTLSPSSLPPSSLVTLFSHLNLPGPAPNTCVIITFASYYASVSRYTLSLSLSQVIYNYVNHLFFFLSHVSVTCTFYLTPLSPPSPPVPYSPSTSTFSLFLHSTFSYPLLTPSLLPILTSHQHQSPSITLRFPVFFLLISLITSFPPLRYYYPLSLHLPPLSYSPLRQ